MNILQRRSKPGLGPIKLGQVTWYLEDASLVEALKEPQKGEARRDYRVIELRGERFFVKAFNEKGTRGILRNLFYPRGKREYLMAKRLSRISIHVPATLGYGISRKASFVVERYVEGQDLTEALRGAERKQILERVASLLSNLNDRHILHGDLHPWNIKISQGSPYLLDLHRARKPIFFCQKHRILNFAQLLCPLWAEMTQDEKEMFFTACGRNVATALKEKMEQLRSQWIRRKERRAFRTTSKIVTRGDLILVKGEDEKRGRLVEVVKRDKKVRIERFEDHVKKYFKSRRRWKRAWRNHIVLLYMGQSITPRPFFAKRPSFFSPPFIAMEDLKDKGQELDRYLDRHFYLMSYHERSRFIESLVQFFFLLLKNGIRHKDLKACNIFVLNDGTFRLLDVEDICFGRMDQKDLKTMLVQLNCSVPLKIGLKERLRFFLPLVRALSMKERPLLAQVIRESISRHIVYEGTNGLVIERWGKKGCR